MRKKDSTASVSRRTLAEQVYHVLKDEIILQQSPEMKMGMKIKEVEIARRLGCSPTPVREAINMLRQDNLIVGNSFHTSEVVSFSQKDVEDLLTMRCELEVSALQQAMPNFTKEDIAALRRTVQDYAKVCEGTDFTRISSVNREFHDYILMKANNRTLTRILRGLVDQAALLRAPVVAARKGTQVRTGAKQAAPVSEHIEIIDAIEKGDTAAACEAMRRHLGRVQNEVCDYYLKYGIEPE